MEKGAPINFQSKNGYSPLHYAAGYGFIEIVMLFIKHKANLDATNREGTTPLIFAADGNHMSIVRALVQAGANISIHGFKNKTAAMQAAEQGHHTIVEYLNHTIRFLPSTKDNSGQLHRVKGRSLRAIDRDLKESGIFANHLLYRLKQLCTSDRR